MSEYEVTVKDGQIQIPEEAIELFAQVRAIDETIKALKAQKDAIETPLKAAMKKHGVDKFQCEYMTATTVKDTVTETVDTERLKRDGLYERYVMFIPKAGYIRINYKKEKKNG